MLQLTVIEMQNRLITDAQILRVQDFLSQDQDQDFDFVLEVPRAQDFVLEDNITAW